MIRKAFARATVAVLLGIATGYAVGKSLKHDAARGRDLTLKEYVADFENHKQELIKSDMSMPMSILAGVIMLVIALGLYELLVFALDRLLDALDRRKNVATQPGTPPPW